MTDVQIVILLCCSIMILLTRIIKDKIIKDNKQHGM